MSYCFLIERQFLLKTKYQFKDSEGDVGDSLYQHHIKNKKPFILLGRNMLNRFIWHYLILLTFIFYPKLYFAIDL